MSSTSGWKTRVSFVEEVRKSGLRADILTLLEDINNPIAKYSFYQEVERLAVLPITTYDEWFSKQLYNKPRNALRKALKSGIEVRLEEFGEPLLLGIKSIYDESPVRQGRQNRHYKKDLETIRKEHSTFLERSQFIAVYFAGEMIGFAKVTFAQELGFIMNFLAKDQPSRQSAKQRHTCESGRDLRRPQGQVPRVWCVGERGQRAGRIQGCERFPVRRGPAILRPAHLDGKGGVASWRSRRNRQADAKGLDRGRRGRAQMVDRRSVQEPACVIDPVPFSATGPGPAGSVMCVTITWRGRVFLHLKTQHSAKNAEFRRGSTIA